MTQAAPLASAVYEGVVRHRRHAPREHAFEYRMAQLYLDLDEVDRAFDAEWGVDTGGTQLLLDLTIDSPNAVLGGSHIATGPHQFASAMSVVSLSPQ